MPAGIVRGGFKMKKFMAIAAFLLAVTVTNVFAETGGKSISSLAELKEYLGKQPANSPDKPVKIALKKLNEKGLEGINKSMAGRYVSLDLSGCPLKEIPSKAFYLCNTLTSVTIPKSVTNIGSGAFNYCLNLKSVTISNGVKSIGAEAFYGCGGLTSVNIPKSVTSIGRGAFRGCRELTGITIPNSVKSIGDQAFYGCGGLASVTIPNSITGIGGAVFADCTGLRSVTIPNSVKSIGRVAFQNCKSLKSITIPGSVTTIEESAFILCTGLTNVTIPKSVKIIENYAFLNCAGLTSVTFAKGSSITNADFGSQAFPEGGGSDEKSLLSSIVQAGITSSGNTLKTAYSAGKAGTYTRADKGEKWTKK
jgi:hypothetical protein